MLARPRALLGARERLREAGGDLRRVVLARLLAREQRVEARDVAAHGVAAEPDGLDERRARPAERIQDEAARGAVPPDQRLGELRRELAEVGVQAVHVLRALALRQRALGPRELEVDLRVQRFLRPGHASTLVAAADGSAGSRKLPRLRRMPESPFAADEPMAELHAHLGGSVPTYVMWESAHAQGIALPTRDYWEFDRMVSISDPRGVDGLDALDQVYHVTELIQSSPLAVERCVHGMIGGGYRSQRITTCEVRFNPMKRNRGGERDLDHIILAALRGVDRAQLEYPQVRAGVILMMDRTFDERQNEIIVEKASATPRAASSASTSPARGPAAARFAYARARAARAAGARGRPRRHGALRRGGLRRGGRRGRRDAAARPHRPRHPRGGRPRADRAARRDGHRARDLPDLEPADGRARRRRRGARRSSARSSTPACA